MAKERPVEWTPQQSMKRYEQLGSLLTDLSNVLYQFEEQLNQAKGYYRSQEPAMGDEDRGEYLTSLQNLEDRLDAVARQIAAMRSEKSRIVRVESDKVLKHL